MPLGTNIRSLIAPLDQALTLLGDIADAVDLLESDKAASDARVVELEKRVAELEAELVEPYTFPGDPGPGKTVIGVEVRGGSLARVLEHEAVTGVKVGRRRYFNGGMADIRVGGPVRAAIVEDHKAGRFPAVSIKPGAFSTISSGLYDAALIDFIRWGEAQPSPFDFIVDHEPENNLKGQPIATVMAGAVKFRADQENVRRLINQVTGGRPRRVSFGGSLMAYTWTAQGTSKSGSPDNWFPVKGTWDWVGADQYAQTAGGPILDGKWAAFKATAKAKGIRIAVTELGIRSEDPDSGNKLRAFYADALANNAARFFYYDNDANSTGTGWILTGVQLDVFRSLLRLPTNVNPVVSA